MEKDKPTPVGFHTLAAQQAEKQNKKAYNLSQVLVVQPPRRDITDIAVWKAAMQSADRGRRAALVNLYDNLLIDTVLSDAVDKRIRAVTNWDIQFLSNGQEIDEMADFIDTPEFEELLTEIMLTKFYGKSVIELNFENGFRIYSVPRQNLNTATKHILRNISDPDGIPYEGDEFLLNLGKDSDLGIFLKTAPHAIFKRNGGSDYAQFCELFGIPILGGMYDPDDENGRVEMETAFEKRGAGGSVVMSNKSKIETIGEAGGNGNNVHKPFLEWCDEQILIGVVSQTMTTKDGSSYSQSKTHGDTEDGLNKADRRYVQRILNRMLLPLLEKRGYPVKDGFFKFVEKDHTTPSEKLSIAKAVNDLTADGVDDDYFYEEFGLPRGKKSEMPEPDPADQDPPETKSKPPKASSKQPKKLTTRELSFFEKLKDFFANAPR